MIITGKIFLKGECNMKKYLLVFLMIFLTSAMFMPVNVAAVLNMVIKKDEEVTLEPGIKYTNVRVRAGGTLVVQPGSTADHVISTGIVQIEGGKVTTLSNECSGEVSIEKGGQVYELNDKSTGTVIVDDGWVAALNNRGNGKINILGKGKVNKLDNHANGEVIVNGETNAMSIIELNNRGDGAITVSGGTVGSLNNTSRGEVNVFQQGKVNRLDNYANGRVAIDGETEAIMVTTLDNRNNGLITVSGGTVGLLNNAGNGGIDILQQGKVNRLDNYTNGKVTVDGETDVIAVATLNNRSNGAITVSSGIIELLINEGNGEINIEKLGEVSKLNSRDQKTVATEGIGIEKGMKD